MKTLKLSKGMVALLDDEDFEKFSARKWCASEQGQRGHELYYAIRKEKQPDGKWKKLWLHREVMACPVGMVVDHEDGDSLNCQKSNLTIRTLEENSLRARIKGWHTRSRATEEDICL